MRLEICAYQHIVNYLSHTDSYEELATNLLTMKSDVGSEDSICWYADIRKDFYDVVCTQKFDGNLGEVLEFIKENSSVEHIATARGTLECRGEASMEVDEGCEPEDIDWDVCPETLDYESYDWMPDADVEITSSIIMIPFGMYSESLEGLGEASE